MRKGGTPTARPGSPASASAANGTAFSNGNPFGSEGSVHGGSQNGSVHDGSANGHGGGAAGQNGSGIGGGGSGIGGGEKTSHSLWLYTRKFVRLLLTKPVRHVAAACRASLVERVKIYRNGSVVLAFSVLDRLPRFWVCSKDPSPWRRRRTS